ncbi:uncharacterized protein LOC119832503 [Zerene cesonia]|uniref:uncharacterized protein LOC119832503 n=1 Tax=Zerene cesonia TaxID=33412 RepID=UPI0018E5A627|nr:uncharacterized protein LOC119832503 [Zerene cesonia]
MALTSHEWSNYSIGLANNTLTQTLYVLIYNLSDILVPAVIINQEKYLTAQMSYSYGFINIVWCVPQRQEILTWAKIILPFLSWLSGFIALSFVFIIIVIKASLHFHKVTKKRNDTVIKTIALFLGQEVKFETEFWLSNLVHVTWIWYCFIVRNVYQGVLIDGLHKSILEPPIRSVNDALQHLDEIVGVAAVVHLYKNTSIAKRYKPLNVNDIPVYLQRIANGERILQAVNEDLILFKRYKVQILDESVSHFPVCIFMRARWPGAEEITRIIARTVEYGLKQRISELHLDRWLRNGARQSNNPTIDSLNMLTLISCFYGLIGMYIVSFVTFCIEILWHKLTRK